MSATATGGHPLLDRIDTLTAANRDRRDPDVDAELVDLRHRAFPELVGPPGRSTWPPPAVDRWPETVDRPPEIGGEALDADAVASAILHHGCLVVRGLLDTTTAAALRVDVERAFDGRDRDTAGTEPSPPWWVPFEPGRQRSTRFASKNYIRAVDSPGTLFDLVDAYRAVGLDTIIAAHLGERPALAANKCALRRARPGGMGQDFHQDGAFLGHGLRTLNVWLALSPCGSDAPTVDLVPRRLDDLVERGTRGAGFDWTVAPTVAEEVAGEIPIHRASFEPGDALLFDEHLLHRTGKAPGMTRDRYAIEAWFFAPSSYPDDQVPVAF